MKNKKMIIERIKHDLTQSDLARLVGVARQTIGLIESGEFNPSLKVCISICVALDCTLDDLFWNL